MSKEVIDATEKFKARAPKAPLVKRALTHLGKAGAPQRDDEAAYTFGKRRAAAIVSVPLLAIGVRSLVESGKSSGVRDERIAACARVLTGHEVEIKHDAEGHMVIPANEDYPEIEACVVSDGDVERAKGRVDEIQVPADAQQP